MTLAEARETIEAWRIDYYVDRPHKSLGQSNPEGNRPKTRSALLIIV